MASMRMQILMGLVVLAPVRGQTVDWRAAEEESMRHFQALVRMDTSDPPGVSGLSSKSSEPS